MAKPLSAPMESYKPPPPSVSVYFNKGQKIPDGFEEVDVDDMATMVVTGRVCRKSRDRNGGSIEIEWKSINLEEKESKAMSLKDAMEKVMSKREM